MNYIYSLTTLFRPIEDNLFSVHILADGFFAILYTPG